MIVAGCAQRESGRKYVRTEVAMMCSASGVLGFSLVFGFWASSWPRQTFPLVLYLDSRIVKEMVDGVD